MATLTAYEITNKIGQKIDYAIGVYDLLLDCDYEPDDAEVNDLIYLRERISALINRSAGEKPVPPSHKPRWQTRG